MTTLSLGFFGKRTVRHVKQTELAECGLACLTMVAGYHGLDIDLNTLRRRHTPSLRGASLKSLMSIADQLGLASRAVKLPLRAMADLHLPALLHWDMNHFVVLERIERQRALILDPALGAARWLSFDDISPHFTGVALELRPVADFSIVNLRQRLRLTQLWGRLQGWKRTAAQTLVLTVVLQAFVLALPYYMQLAVDSALPASDRNLLFILALGFGLFTLFNVGATLMRDGVLLSAGATMGFSLGTNVGRKLFRLPVEWFERRHVGDVLSRFQSVHPIQKALTEGIVGSLVDGVLAVTTLALMFWYSATLTAISLVAFVLYLAVRIVSFVFERNAREASIVAASKEQSTLIETIRGIIPLRLFSQESERHSVWQNRLADATNAEVHVARIGMWQRSASNLILGLENVIVIWLAIGLVMSGGFSLGMVFAYLAYKQQFLSRGSTLIDQSMAFRMLDLHLDRLGDIALEGDDRGFLTSFNQKEISGGIELQAVSYRYSPSDPLILDEVNVTIAPGSHVAITGVSGGGKSTLAKVLLGLVEPEAGQVLVDGHPLREIGLRTYRSQVAAVLQQDHLFAGSIADNISLFDDTADFRRVMQAASLAAVHEEIVAMPMQYETLVGDMGSTLSGGQKARLLLARALYRKPRLLVLDEGTAHLDPDTEAMVNSAIAKLGITRIVIAHRIETIRAAEQVYVMSGGKLTPAEAGPKEGC